MADYKEVDREISQLQSILPGDLFSSDRTDWKSVWKQIGVVSSAFKGTKYPTHEDHQRAWETFQALIEKVKSRQEEDNKKWNQKKTESADLRDRIISQAEKAIPSDAFADMILMLATGGLSAVVKLTFDAIFGPFDERKYELQKCSEELKKGWGLLSQYKAGMFGRDKQEAFQHLNQAKEKLDREWGQYKKERQEAYENFQREREEKHQSWRIRVENNLYKLYERREKLNSALSKRESHLSELHDKLSDAWSDSFRDRVSGWLEEEKSNISEIHGKISTVEDWIQEERAKLNN